MRALIVFGSRHGHTQKVAERIAVIISARGAEVSLREARTLPKRFGVRRFGIVVVLSPVYFGKHLRAMETFVIDHRSELEETRSAFVSVSGAMRTDEGRPMAEEAVKKFLDRTGWTPARTAMFAGGEPYSRYGWFTRWFMKRHWKKLGRVVETNRDYDYTDWSAVEAFAKALLQEAAGDVSGAVRA